MDGTPRVLMQTAEFPFRPVEEEPELAAAPEVRGCSDGAPHEGRARPLNSQHGGTGVQESHQRSSLDISASAEPRVRQP